VSDPLHIEVSTLAAAQVHAAETWWQLNRAKAPGAIRAELERASSLIAFQPHIGARARNVALHGVRRLRLGRIHYDLYYRLVETPRRLEILAFWHASRESQPPI
jgi:plasmid stabilization system protein ParE